MNIIENYKDLMRKIRIIRHEEEISKRMLKHGISVDDVVKIMGFPKKVVLHFKEQVENENTQEES